MFELRFVMICRIQRHYHQIAFFQLFSLKLKIFARPSRRTEFYRPIEAQRFFDGLSNQLRLLFQQLSLLGMFHQGQHCIADQIHRGFMSGDDQQRHVQKR